MLTSRRRRSPSSGTYLAKRDDIAESQRSPSCAEANTSRGGLTLLIEPRITEATSSDRVSSRCAPASASEGDKSSALPASSRRRRCKDTGD
jgi:hypothetical protein